MKQRHSLTAVTHNGDFTTVKSIDGTAVVDRLRGKVLEVSWDASDAELKHLVSLARGGR